MLQESRATLQKQASTTSIIYDAGFQLDSADQWFEYPYVLVQPLPYGKFGLHRQINEDEFQKYVRMLTGLDVSKIVDESVSTDARQLLGNIDAGQPQLDATNRRFLWTITQQAEI